MSRFKKDGGREMPELNTSSLPDLIFSVLFFFMMVTTMREVTLKVQVVVPQGTELEKLEKKSLVSFIYVGPPMPLEQARYGRETRIQLNDKFCEPSDVISYVGQERQKMGSEGAKQIVSIKGDKGTKMGIITDIKQQLRKAYALRINYSAGQRK